MTLTKGWLRGVAGAALLAGGVGCGGIGPGDYVVYRIALGETETGSDCYGGGQLPTDPDGHSTSIYTSDTFILYATNDETFYLDTGVITLEGVEPSSDSYEFEGEIEDVTYLGTNTTETDTTATRVELIVDGAVVEGIYEQQDSYECNGSMCSDSDIDTSCTLTTPFVGTEVEDVQIKHEV